MYFIKLFLLGCFFSIHIATADNIILVSKVTIENKIKVVGQIKELKEEEKQTLITTYSIIIEQLDLIKIHKQQQEFYINSRKTIPLEIKSLTKKVDKIEKIQLRAQKQNNPQDIKSKHSLSKFEQMLEFESTNLVTTLSINSELKQKINSETNSPPSIRKHLIDVNQTLEQLISDKNLSAPDSISKVQKQALQWLFDVKIAALRSEIKMVNDKLLIQPNFLKLLRLKKQISDQLLTIATEKVHFLENQVALKRKIEIQKTQEVTRTEQIKAQDKHPFVLAFAKLNSEISDYINLKNKRLTHVEQADDTVNQQTQRISDSHNNTKKKLEIAGLNEVLGQVLLKQKFNLPNINRYSKNIKKRKRLLVLSELKNFEHQEELVKIKKTKTYITALINNISPALNSTEEQVNVEKDLMALVATRKKLLKKVISLDNSYFKAITDLDFAENKLIIVAKKYAQLLDEHLLWMPNAPVLNITNIVNIPGQLITLLSLSHLSQFGNDFIHMISTSLMFIPAMLLLMFFLTQKNKMISLIVNAGLKTKKISKDNMLHTFKAIFYTLFLAIIAVLFISLISWQLSLTADISEFSISISTALNTIILPLFFLQSFYYMCLPGGLFEVHFKWPEIITTHLSKEMMRLMFTLLPIMFFTAVLLANGEATGNLNLGRLSLLLTLLTFTIFFYRLLKPKTGFIHSIGKAKGLFSHYQAIWFFLSQTIVICLIALSIAGYIYTAGQLTKSLMYTVCFIFILVLIQQIIVRWLLLNRHRYALNLAYEKRKAKQLTQSNEQTDTEGREHIIDISEPEIDMISISEESTKLVNMLLIILGISGLIGIWSSILPAFGIFDKVELWHHISIVNGNEKLLPITLGDFGFGVLVIIITLISAKRLPAIIEIILIQSTHITSGNRYTITTLINYTIIGIGFFSVFNILGAEWAKFQWLFAALSVGIGFGLQEIVANFISGLIILFERPIRVGDYISVGENEGIVSRIQIRATTILTRDRKELLVPNKEFITGQLLNWSLSDPTTRLIIPVGVAYGSNIPKAKEILIACAHDHEEVLKEPKPKVIFYNFGDNTLDLQLRCFIADVDNRLDTISQINEEINHRFEQAEINIAFPQRDVHLDINHPLEINLNTPRKNA